jgi:multicomponent Na+:H+ antiporter subunit G
MEWLTAAFWIFGATLAVLAAVGVLRMPDLFTRMQAAAKASTMGLGCLLIGTAIEFGDSATTAKAISIAAFIMLTSPVAAHVVARAAYLTDVPLWSGTAVDERREEREAAEAAEAQAREEKA